MLRERIKIRFWLWVAFLIPDWLAYCASLRLLNSYCKEKNLTATQIKNIRYSTVLRNWKVKND